MTRNLRLGAAGRRDGRATCGSAPLGVFGRRDGRATCGSAGVIGQTADQQHEGNDPGLRFDIHTQTRVHA
jgi:hypothetical protein